MRTIFEISKRQTIQLSKYAVLLDVFLRVFDLLIVFVGAWLCWSLRFGSTTIPRQYMFGVVIVLLLMMIVFPASGAYRSWWNERLRDEIIRVWGCWALTLAIFLVIQWTLKSTSKYSRLWVGSWFLLVAILFVVERWFVRVVLGKIRRDGVDFRSVVIVGVTASGQRLAKILEEALWGGLKIVGYVSTPFDKGTYGNLPCIGTVESYVVSAKDSFPDQVWLALPLRAEPLIRHCLDVLQDLPITVRLIPDLLDYRLINQNATEIAGIPIITLRGSRLEGYARLLKAIEDRVLSALILLVLSPLMLLIALGVKLSSNGPVFFRQKRVGWNGQIFEMLKFRSMQVDSENEHVRWGDAKNKKVTRFGAFLRRTSLDELPQFVNVFFGNMSIVGPRPERPEFVSQFRGQIEGYMQKHLVKAGITGWAQVNGWRGDTDLQARIEHDLFYIENWSLAFDLKIILFTALRIFSDRNAY